jgi:hypothetical protein
MRRVSKGCGDSMSPLVYESHITIEPVFGERFTLFSNCSRYFGFKPAKLLMQKDRDVTAERSDKDSFCTGHAHSYDELLHSTKLLVRVLQHEGFKVWRYKIEAILTDVKLKEENGSGQD